MTSSNYNNNNDKYAHLRQYGEDLQRSKIGGTEIAPDVPYTSDWPTCALCNRPMDHDWENKRYRCNFCIISIREVDAPYSELNKNRRYETLAEKAAKSIEEQQRDIDNRNRARERDAEQRAKLQTQSGEDFESGSGRKGKGVLFQLDSPHDIVRRNNDIQAGRYSDHSRRSLREKPTILHPLDHELVERGYQITNSFEVNNRQPNSPGIVDRSKVRGGERKSYDRYGDSANQVDLYDKI